MGADLEEVTFFYHFVRDRNRDVKKLHACSNSAWMFKRCNTV